MGTASLPVLCDKCSFVLPSGTRLQTHRLKRSETGEFIFLRLTYDEWFERKYSDGWTNHWCILLDDGTMAYDYGLLHSKFNHQPGNWPMASSACGGHPDEIPEMMAHDKKLGVSAEYNTDGDPIFTSKSHRKKYCEAHGIFDRNAGYGDPQPKNIT